MKKYLVYNTVHKQYLKSSVWDMKKAVQTSVFIHDAEPMYIDDADRCKMMLNSVTGTISWEVILSGHFNFGTRGETLEESYPEFKLQDAEDIDGNKIQILVFKKQ